MDAAFIAFHVVLPASVVECRYPAIVSAEAETTVRVDETEESEIEDEPEASDNEEAADKEETEEE